MAAHLATAVLILKPVAAPPPEAASTRSVIFKSLSLETTALEMITAIVAIAVIVSPVATHAAFG